MRLVNLAHGDLIVLAAYLILVARDGARPGSFPRALIAVPVMFAVGWAPAVALLNRTLGEDILPPLLVTFGLSIVIQNALLEGFSADSRRIPAGALETASRRARPRIAVGVMPLLTLFRRSLVIVALNWIFYRTPLGRAFRATSDDPVTAQPDGHRRPTASSPSPRGSRWSS